MALAAFLLFLGALSESSDESVFDRVDELTEIFNLPDFAPEAFARLNEGFIHHIVSGFRRPTIGHSKHLETIASLAIRHAGAMVFQEAHFVLSERGGSDIFGVPAAAPVEPKTSGGVHFTPPGLARAVVEQSLQAYGELPPRITILDPACGSGSILHEAIRILRDRGYQGDIRIVGFDESAYAVMMTRFLLASAKRDWPALRLSSIEVACRNSLDDCPWPQADIIVMNPPFVSLRELSTEQRKLLSNVLGPFDKGRPDLSMAFLERALHSIADSGVVGSLIPAGVLSMTHGKEWRRHILDKATVAFVALFGELGLFRMATVETGCVVLSKSRRPGAYWYKSLWVGEKRNATSEALRLLRKATMHDAGIEEGDAWSLDELPIERLETSVSWRPKSSALRRKIDRIRDRIGTTVGSAFHVRQGAIPAPRSAFIISRSTWDRLPRNEQRWFRQIAENANIRDGQIRSGQFVFYPKSEGLRSLDNEETLRQECPVFYKHLSQFKSALIRRRRKEERWWELGEDRKWLRTPRQKIVTSYFGQPGSFAFDQRGDHVVVQGYGWMPRWRLPESVGITNEYLCYAYIAVFNSLLFADMMSDVCPTVGGGQFNLSKRYSERVVLPDLAKRVEAAAGSDSVVRELASIGENIGSHGLLVSPRSRTEELVEIMYGV
jgi:hypothetical protein